MNINLSPKTARNLARLLPFPIIWLISGWVFNLVEFAAFDSSVSTNNTAVEVDLSVGVFATVAMLLVGLLVGIIELVFLERAFRNRSFLVKIAYKLLFYLVLLFTIIAVLYPIAVSIELGVTIGDERVWDKFFDFMGSVTFYSTLLQLGFQVLLCVIYAAVSEHLGYGVLVNFLTGRYHQPREELRIFMFLDMRSSTQIAEKLGNKKYFLFLRDFYDDLTNAIIDHGGEVYQYIGDEVVISWKMKNGLQDNNCIRCFFAMERDLSKRSPYYQQEYGKIPAFKAGLHFGLVTTGEIGALKKEIAFTGDVLNTTARIQALCNQYGEDLLVSAPLMDSINLDHSYKIDNLGEVKLQGREEVMELYAVSREHV